MRFTLVFLLALVSIPALADSGGEATDGAIQLRPNLGWSIGRADGERTHGFALDLELRVFPNRSPWRYGGFVGGELLLDGSERVVAGVSGGFGGFGLQLGVAQRTGADGFAPSTGLHIGKTFTWGPAGISFRMTVPLADRQPAQGLALQSRGLEHAVMFTLGWSIDVSGHRPAWGHCHHRHERAE